MQKGSPTAAMSKALDDQPAKNNTGASSFSDYEEEDSGPSLLQQFQTLRQDEQTRRFGLLIVLYVSTICLYHLIRYIIGTPPCGKCICDCTSDVAQFWVDVKSNGVWASVQRQSQKWAKVT